MVPVVSIPIIILRRANIKFAQKVALGAFLCLSLVMALLAIVRVSKVRGEAGRVDIPWEFFFMFMEASVAVIMGSLTAFRTLFVNDTDHSRGSDRKNARAKAWLTNTYLRVKRGGIRRKGDLECQDLDEDGFPRIPGATMTGLHTFLRGNNRSDAEFTSKGGVTSMLELGTLVSDEEAQFPAKLPAARVYVQKGWDVREEECHTPVSSPQDLAFACRRTSRLILSIMANASR
jgi:hypothetical protein